MTTIIKNGRIVTAGDEFVADIMIEGEQISMIGQNLDVEDARVINAKGKM